MCLCLLHPHIKCVFTPTSRSLLSPPLYLQAHGSDDTFCIMHMHKGMFFFFFFGVWARFCVADNVTSTSRPVRLGSNIRLCPDAEASEQDWYMQSKQSIWSVNQHRGTADIKNISLQLNLNVDLKWRRLRVRLTTTLNINVNPTVTLPVFFWNN